MKRSVRRRGPVGGESRLRAGIVLFLLSALFVSTCAHAAATTDFVRARGDRIVVGAENREIFLRGVNVDACRLVPRGGGDWYAEGEGDNPFPSDDADVPVVLNEDWYNQGHFRTAARIGFNVIRVHLTYRIFEDNGNPGRYKKEGWNWLDKYVLWAKKHGLYLILSMTAPQGGYQPTGGGGAALWEDNRVRQRFRNLWKAIAERYADEPTIAAYDLLNEPHPTSSRTDERGDNAQWKALAKELIKDIRSVDTNHLIIVEAVDWVDDGSLEKRTAEVLKTFQVPVGDRNVMYDYHFYLPFGYSDVIRGAYPSRRKATAINGSHMPVDKNYLNTELQTVVRFAERNNAPINFGEWGGTAAGLSRESGGGTYTRDLLSLMDERNIHWTYHVFNNFYSDHHMTKIVPDRVNVFTEYFGTAAFRNTRRRR